MDIKDRFKPFSQLPTAEKLYRAKEDFKYSQAADSIFQNRAKIANRFYAGNQYTDEEKAELKRQERPDLVCNLVKPTVELIKGVNEQNRIVVKASATEQGDGFLADLLNDCYDKVRQIESVEMVEDDAFENMVITGRGFAAIDVAGDPKQPGEIKIPVVSIPPSEVRLDPAGRKDDLSDHRMIFWHRWITLEDFAIKYPNHIGDIEDILAGESSGDLEPGGGDLGDFDISDMATDTPRDEEYSRVIDSGYYDKTNGHIRVVHMEYWDNYDRYYGVNPQTGQLEEFGKDILDRLKRVLPGLQYQTIKDKKVKWFQFTGHKALFDGDSPIPYDGFSIVAEFAYNDKSNENITHFGIVKDMIDPQREANKRWSQTLNLYLKQSQGGYLVEAGAVVDETHWKDTINAPGEDTVVADGAISGGKIKEKPMPQLPVGALNMHELAQDLLKKVSGVNPDLLGQAGTRGEPGVVIRIRQQQGLTILAKLFKNHHRMQEALAKRIFAIIMKYMPPTQIQRILGDSKGYVFKGDLVADIKNQVIAPIRNLKDLKYNIDTDESPANMTKNMAQLATFIEMMSKGFPVDPKTVVRRLDLPESDKKEWEAYIDQMQQMQAQQAQMQMELQTGKIQGDLQLKAQDMQARTEIEAKRLSLDVAKLHMDGQAQDMKSQIDAANTEIKDEDSTRRFGIEMAKLDLEKQKLVMEVIKSMSGPDEKQTQARMGVS